MRFTLLLLALSAFLFFPACQKATTKLENKPKSTVDANRWTADPLDNVPRISAEDAKKEFDNGTAVFVDTRAEFVYRAEHVKGAINLPMEAFDARYREIPTGKKIIAYCD